MRSYLQPRPGPEIIRPARPTAASPEPSVFQGWGPRL
jgi:hypothetical protein